MYSVHIPPDRVLYENPPPSPCPFLTLAQLSNSPSLISPLPLIHHLCRLVKYHTHECWACHLLFCPVLSPSLWALFIVYRGTFSNIVPMIGVMIRRR